MIAIFFFAGYQSIDTGSSRFVMFLDPNFKLNIFLIKIKDVLS